jgi:hypothetical protein
VCFAYAFVSALQAPLESVHEDAADPYGRGPFGYRGLVEASTALGLPVSVNRRDPALLGDDGVVFVGLPWAEGEGRRALRRALSAFEGPTLAVTLPKWRPVGGAAAGVGEETAGPRYEAVPLPELAVFATELGFDVELEPVPGLDRLGTPTGDEVPVEVRVPRRFAATDPAATPNGEPADCLLPVPSGGCLDARFEGRGGSVHLFAEPDLFANFGLVRAGNATAAVAALDALRGDGPVVFDARVHGYDVPLLWPSLFEPPLVFATVQLVLLGLMAVAAGLPRFGAAVPEAPALSAGRRALVENTVRLLHGGGHAAYTLGRYWQAVARDLGQRLRVPGEDHAARVRGLVAVSATPAELRALDADVADAVARRLDPRSILRLARRIAALRARMTGGREARPGAPQAP